MARPRKPTALHVVDGTFRADRQPRKTLTPGAKMPDAPAHVRRDLIAFTEWRRIAREFAGLGMITALDRGPLAAVCVLYGRWVRAENALAKMGERDATTHGLIIRTALGNAIQNPLVGIANRAMLMYVRMCREFGMTPAARAGIEMAPGPTDDETPAGRYF
ncbi:phage terminase small subunit P27 family [Paraburkholderia antibiotica]|uniref:Phage terminase small subunit P27 family n=1 Tax=Paraburkholderia antibiotica TaxID=2728839 RepID=A0A7X9ZWK8_9BURK|nr:phage terminase small subunit P27 family [Paraburkholderia antibiotica]NML29393.1 phage terminase small subunit P27 family [Paraburkholderia antibiotica]